MLLNEIHTRADLLRLTPQENQQLCAEIREFLVRHIARTGGHLASNLGVVELTVALHQVYDTEKDRILFDVGHQSYVHKILTGRMDRFSTLRTYGGLAGFPKPSESVHDAFIAGHASESVSVALGMARARTLLHEDYSVVAVLGDGALTGGLAYEGLNDAGASGEPLVVVLNDNGMSITTNVGAISRHLKLLRLKPGYFGLKKAYRQFTRKIPGGAALYRFTHGLKTRLRRRLIGVTIFEEMGFSYLGPVDGHDVEKLKFLLKEAKGMNCPVLLHVITKKGKGYIPAEVTPSKYHGVGRFNPVTGLSAGGSGKSFSETFGQTLCDLAIEDQRICAITAAMEQGTGLSQFAASFHDRYFDVGIAEGHAVSMAAGLAKQGLLPVFAVYSTFLQRSYDMLQQDVGLLGLHVVLAVDRAGLVGEDGETHHGVFDVGYLRQIPGMTVFCPASQAELRRMLREAILETRPRGGALSPRRKRRLRWRGVGKSVLRRACCDHCHLWHYHQRCFGGRQAAAGRAYFRGSHQARSDCAPSPGARPAIPRAQRKAPGGRRNCCCRMRGQRDSRPAGARGRCTQCGAAYQPPVRLGAPRKPPPAAPSYRLG